MENKKTVNIGHFLNRLDDSRLKNKILCTPRIWELLISVSKMSVFYVSKSFRVRAKCLLQTFKKL